MQLAVTNNGSTLATNSTAAAVNNHGTIAGFFTDTAGVQAGFVASIGRRTGTLGYTTVTVPGATITQVLGINDAGVLVGDFTDAAGKMHGFVDNNGSFQTIDGPNATATTINGVNDFGEISGFFTDQNNNTIGLVGTPGGGTTIAASASGINLGTTGGVYMVQGTANVEGASITGAGALTIEIAPGTTGPASVSFTAAAISYAQPVTIVGATLDIAAAGAVGTGAINFTNGVAGELKIEAAARPFPNTISGFVFGDTIDLPGFTTTASTATLGAGGTLTLTGSSTVILTLDTGFDPVGTIVRVQSDGAGGTFVTVPPLHQSLAFPANVSGDVFTQLLGINNAGTIVGYHGSGMTGHPNIGEVLTPPSPPGTFAVLNFPGSVQTQVFAINTTGTVDGFYIDTAGVQHGFIDAGGTFTTVDDKPGNVVQPVNQLLGLNDNGIAVGYYQDTAGDQHPYIDSFGTFIPINITGISTTVGGQATGINNNFEEVGFFTDTGGVEHGFVDNANTITNVDVPNATATQVLSVNDGGVLVGDFVDAGGVTHGFIDDAGIFTTVTLGTVTTFLQGINDFNQTVGFSANDATNTTDNGTVLVPNGTAQAPLRIGQVIIESTTTGVYNVSGTFNTLAGPITGGGTLTLQRYVNATGAAAAAITSANNAIGATVVGSTTLDLAAQRALGTGSITFAAAPAVLKLETAAGTLGNAIAGFNATDAIDVAGVAATARTATLSSAGVLTIPTAGGSTTLQFSTSSLNAAGLPATPAGTVFSLLADNNGGTTVTLARNYTLAVRNDPGDPTFNQLLGVTNSETIVGYFGVGSTTATPAAIPNTGRMLVPPYGNTNFTTLNIPAQTQVFALNTSGRAVGFFGNAAATAQVGFEETGGTFVTVADTPVAGVVVNQLLGENNLGAAAGFWQDPTATNGIFLTHGYTVSGGVVTNGTLTGAAFTEIAPPTAISSMDTSINDTGAVAGFFTDNTANAVQHGFVFNAISGYTTIDAPGATATQILGMNNGGVLVGDYTDAGGVMHGFVDDHGAFTVIDGPNSNATTVNGINDFNEIVGFNVDATSGFTIGFIGTPNGGGGFVSQVENAVSTPGGAGLEYLQGTNNIVGANLTSTSPNALQLAPGATSARVAFTATNNGGAALTVGAGITADLAADGAAVVNRGSIFFTSSNLSDVIVEPIDISFNNPVVGFAAGDTLDLRGVATTATTGTVSAAGTLAIPLTGGGTRTQLFTSNANQMLRFVADGAGGTAIVACFASGTRIRTERGEIAVEHLRVGDLVPTMFGTAAQPIVWIGTRKVDCKRHPHPEDVIPVLVRRGAFGDGLPVRDLRLSPDHAVYAEGRLVPIRHLVNGSTIVVEQAASVTYWHIELSAHNVLFAEGLPAESYLETGNRGAFGNAGVVMPLYPSFAPGARPVGCAPLLTRGPQLEALRTRLATAFPANEGRAPQAEPAHAHLRPVSHC